jgi:hypothetical protein
MRDTFEFMDEQPRGRFAENELDGAAASGLRSTGGGAKSDLVDLTLRYCGQTALALGVKKPDDADLFAGPSRTPLDDGPRRNKWTWLAKSKIEFEMKATGTVRVTLPQWLAQEKGLI